MESYNKIFAEDLNSGRSDTRNARMQTLSGRTIAKCCFCGALTEISDVQKPVSTLSIYDPTGILAVRYHTGNKDISSFLHDTTLPAFVLCTADIRCSAGACIPTLESIVPVARDVRDTFVLAAADDLIRHLAAYPSTAPDRRNQICSMAEKALSTVQKETPKPPAQENVSLDTAESLIQEYCADKTAVGLEDVVAALQHRGISRETTLAALTNLITSGDCYQPKPDVIRLL